MKIAQISSCWLTTPPSSGYGGTEWVVSYLTEQLVALGHDVTLCATGDSFTKGHLWYWFDAPTLNYQVTDEMIHVAKAYEYIYSSGFDIIHNHTYRMGPALLSLSDMPSVTTFHGGSSPGEIQFYKAFSPSHYYVAISHRQRQLMPGVNWIGTVHNGVDPADYPFVPDKDDYFLFMGLIAPRKGPHLAIQAARVAGQRLKIAGPIPEHEGALSYFEQEIAPWVDGQQIEYVGEADFARKVELFQHAQALLVPACWEEPFGMVIIEALACGTPVIAFPRGAAPEIIVPSRVGFLVEEAEGMASAMGNVRLLSPWACREHVERHFSARLMAERYVQIYEWILDASRRRTSPTRVIQAPLRAVQMPSSNGNGLAQNGQMVAPDRET